MYSVWQHWDPLRVCIVGRTWPPEFYSWITVPKVRGLFERIAQETEEDLDRIVKILESFGVEVLRPELPERHLSPRGKYFRPPMNPRDYLAMIGTRFYDNFHFNTPWASTELVTKADPSGRLNCYTSIIDRVGQQGNTIRTKIDPNFNTAMITRVGRDLYHGTMDPLTEQGKADLQSRTDREFPEFRNHVIDSRGHIDGNYCPVVPGLIVSLYDVQEYEKTFPGWEVVYLPDQSWSAIEPFLELKHKNQGRWWIPGWERDQDLIDIVEGWLSHWTGYVEETVFDVNMLVIDTKNVIVFNHNDKVFDAFARHGITPHVAPLRHRYFWDGGIHCVTSDLHREGTMQDWFPHRS